MTYTEVQTTTEKGSPLSEAEGNTILTNQRDHEARVLTLEAGGGGGALTEHYVRLERDTTQAVGPSQTVMQWDNEVTDSDGFADLVADNTLITIPAGFPATKAIISGGIRFGATSSNVFFYIYKSVDGGSTWVMVNGDSTNGGTLARYPSVSTEVDVAPGDQFRLEVGGP